METLRIMKGGADMRGGRSETATFLAALLDEAGLTELTPEESSRFATYLELLLWWNARTNLTSVRDSEGILRRHFVECIACARSLPTGVTSVLDFGSGAGFPGIPIAVCRPELEVTLAEAQNKKAAFLNEVVRTLELRAKVFCGRAESMGLTFDCVTLRAVDDMTTAVRAAVELLKPNGHLAVMTTEGSRDQVRSAADSYVRWGAEVPLPFSEQRILILASRSS
jgi:16S rRNA (guanine527-N7)-methyltransferase